MVVGAVLPLSVEVLLEIGKEEVVADVNVPDELTVRELIVDELAVELDELLVPVPEPTPFPVKVSSSSSSSTVPLIPIVQGRRVRCSCVSYTNLTGADERMLEDHPMRPFRETSQRFPLMLKFRSSSAKFILTGNVLLKGWVGWLAITLSKD